MKVMSLDFHRPSLGLLKGNGQFNVPYLDYTPMADGLQVESNPGELRAVFDEMDSKSPAGPLSAH